MGGQPLEADVIVVVFPLGHVRHLEVLLGDGQRIVAGADCQVQVALCSADAGEHHGRGLEVH